MAGAPPPPPGVKRQTRLTFTDDDEEHVKFRSRISRAARLSGLPGAKTIVARAVAAMQGRFMDFFYSRAATTTLTTADELEPRLEMVKGGRV